jgi:hypothetical protein
LDVTTVDNKTFGIKAGQSGKLHIFNAINPESFAAPLNFGYLNEYDQNYSVIRDAIANGGGFNVLKDAPRNTASEPGQGRSASHQTNHPKANQPSKKPGMVAGLLVLQLKRAEYGSAQTLRL